MKDYFISYFDRYLDQLKAEIMAYPNEKSLWQTAGTISNSAGNLACHLVGNLNHFVGAVIGKTGYQRNRPLEFSVRDLPREELLQQIEQTKVMMREVISNTNLEAPFPEELYGEKGSNTYFIMRFLAHFTYHLGQINYHRRLIEAVG